MMDIGARRIKTTEGERKRLSCGQGKWTARTGRAVKRVYNRRMRHSLSQALAALDTGGDYAC